MFNIRRRSVLMENGIMPGKYVAIFNNRIRNALAGRPGDVEKAIAEFYRDFSGSLRGITMKNLEKMAYELQRNEGRGNFTPDATELDPDEWWDQQLEESKTNKNMKKNVVRLNESQLRSLVKKSVKRVLREMQEGLEDMAREMYGYVDNWETEVVDQDGGYATGYMYGSVEDENGGVWEFEADCGFNWEGDWVIDDDSIEDISFTAPDGTTGSI